MVTTLRPISVVFTLPQQTLPQVAAIEASRGHGGAEVLALPQDGSGQDGAAPGLCWTAAVWRCWTTTVDQSDRHDQAEGDLPEP